MTRSARVPDRAEIGGEQVAAAATRRGQSVQRRPLAPGALAFRVPDAAQMIGVSRSKLWKMIAEEEIEARKIGAATVIRREALEAYMDGTALRVRKAAQ